MLGILFDKDGTLLEFEATWTPILHTLALDFADGDPIRAEKLMVAGGLDRESGRIRAGSPLAAGTSVEIARAWAPNLAEVALRARVAVMEARFHEHGVRHSVSVAGLGDTLARLADMGAVMGVATNDGTAAAKAAIAAIGAERFLPHVFGYDSVARPKPAPDMVHAFAAAAGVALADIVVVGDNRHDLEMARSAGVALAIGVASGNSSVEDLAPLADAVIDSIRDLPGFLQKDSWLDQNRK